MRIHGIMQHDNRDCGAACLATICEYYGVKIPLVKIREKMKIDKNGASIYALTRAANEFNFNTSVIQGQIDELYEEVDKKNIKLPIVAHFIEENFNGHYVIITRIKRNEINIFDPARGKLVITKNDFQKKWSGYLIVINKDNTLKKENMRKNTYKKFWKLFLKQKKVLIVILCISFLLGGITILSSVAYQKIVDNFILGNQLEEISYLGDNILIGELVVSLNKFMFNFNYFFIALIVLFIIQMFLNVIKGCLISRISKHVNFDLMQLYFNKTIRLPMSFFKDRETGEILSRFSDIAEIENLISQMGMTIIVNIFLIFTSAIVLYRISDYMFLMVIVILMLYAFIVWVFKKKINEVKMKALEENSCLITELKEDIDNIGNIKNACLENCKGKKLVIKSKKLLDYIYKGKIIANVQAALFGNIESIGVICILWLGSLLVIQGKISIGNLIVFESLIHFFLSPFKQLIGMQIELQGSFIAMERLNDILEVKADNEIYRGDKRPDLRKSDIFFKDISFGYNYDEEILQNINLKFEYGNSYAIVGKSGCGKSTLMKLLVGYFQYDAGKIFIGNCDFQDISLDYLRHKIKYISNDIYLFAGTILENLVSDEYVDIEKKEFNKIISGCRVDEILQDLPNGVYTKVSERGMELSSGQRQRIILAQALLSRPDVLILDEATNHLDEKMEKEIFNFVLEYCKDITCLFVLHNSELASLCKHVVLLDRGKVIKTV